MCYFPRRFFTARPSAPRSQPQNSRGVAQNGEKGWRTDQIRSPDNHLQRHRALAQASQRRLRFAGGRDQEEPARQRSVHKPGLLKVKVVKKPGTKARRGNNPFTGQKMMFKAKPASKKRTEE